MPICEYDCPHCGDFTMLRPMAERDTPCACPYCETESARVILSAPGLATMPGSQRRAIETNERSRHAPQTLEEYKANRKHPAGCSCCGPSKPVERTKANPHGLKASPSARPWMISHRGCLLGSRQRGDDVGHGHHLSTVIPAQAGTQRHSAAALPGTT